MPGPGQGLLWTEYGCVSFPPSLPVGSAEITRPEPRVRRGRLCSSENPVEQKEPCQGLAV